MLAWISCYHSDRKPKVWYQDYLSDQNSLNLGTLQRVALSPVISNVLMNKIATASYPRSVQPIIYADDVLLQSKSFPALELALGQLNKSCKSLGVVMQEEKKN